MSNVNRALRISDGLYWCPYHKAENGSTAARGAYVPIDQFNIELNTRKPHGYCKACRHARRMDLNGKRGGPGVRQRYTGTRNSAKLRGIEFDLTYEEYLRVVSRPCAYGIQGIVKGSVQGRGKQNPALHIGVDRKDNSKGYTVENSTPCCSAHNQFKSDVLTYDQMLDAARRYGIPCGNTRAGRKRSINTVQSATGQVEEAGE